MRKSKRILFITMLMSGLAVHSNVQAQNILDLQGWGVGEGRAGIFAPNGQVSENIREWGIGPHGKPSILWKAVPDGNAHDDGGWNSDTFPIVHSNMYRYTVWLKKSNSFTGVSYFGCQAVLKLDGFNENNPYFWLGNLPELDRWYLVVGYIHGSADLSTIHYGGVYDGVTGLKVANASDFKFAIGDTQGNHRAYLFYDANVNDRQYFYAPRVDLVNGNEPTIATLLGLQGMSGESVYFSGKVGIKTTNPGEYDLAVNGKVKAREIKVEGGIWPDYVFEDGYKFETLDELNSFIKLNKHLPNIPSAKDIENKGHDLGEMNKMLLEKIEELSLHLIEKDRQINRLENRMNKVENQNKK